MPSILIVADPLLPVPPELYGGIERIVGFLAEGLSQNGWDVTLACHKNSTCEVRKIFHPTTSNRRFSRLKNIANICLQTLFRNYDIVHSFGHYDMIAPLWPVRRSLIQSFQSIPSWEAFARRARWIPKRNLVFTTCGFHMTGQFSSLAPTKGIHNGVIIEQFTFQPDVPSDAPLVFLGRIEQIKGAHIAIQVARATGRCLIIAGNRSVDPKIDQYFVNEIEPLLDERITYIGPVNDAQKNHLLGKAAAFLMPIEWDEPFGIVMAEALACGTPVIGLNRGAVPEVVEDGVTGACCNNVEEMIAAIGNIGNFSRAACHLSATTKFSSGVIVEQYLHLYREILDDSRRRPHTTKIS